MTGTFDSWSKSVRLEKKNDILQSTVHLDDSADKIYYKVRSTLCHHPLLPKPARSPRVRPVMTQTDEEREMKGRRP